MIPRRGRPGLQHPLLLASARKESGGVLWLLLFPVQCDESTWLPVLRRRTGHKHTGSLTCEHVARIIIGLGILEVGQKLLRKRHKSEDHGDEPVSLSWVPSRPLVSLDLTSGPVLSPAAAHGLKVVRRLPRDSVTVTFELGDPGEIRF